MTQHTTPIPTRWIGPIHIHGNTVNEAVQVPLATYETPLWPSTARGAKISRLCDGIRVTLIDERMTRSVVLQAQHAQHALETYQRLQTQLPQLQHLVSQTSRFATLDKLHAQILGNLLFLRLECLTGDASGHNMVTKAADALLKWILESDKTLQYASISANLCVDKKVSAINGILGRGKNVIAEITIPEIILSKHLRTTAAKMVDLNTHKNHLGSNLAGSIRSANAHFANMLLAFYLATGQDAANIIEGSQGIVHCQNQEGQLYFSCTLPNLIVGSVGNGKGQHLSTIEQHLQTLGCREERPIGDNARRLAAICAATVLCGELSLLAAQTNPGELMRSHLAMERHS